MAEIERIRSERKTDRGMEYLVRWKGFSSEHDTWLSATEIQGLGSLLQYWRDKNKRANESKKLKQNQQQASKLPPAYKPNREPKVGDVIAIYAPKDMDELETSLTNQIRNFTCTGGRRRRSTGRGRHNSWQRRAKAMLARLPTGFGKKAAWMC